MLVVLLDLASMEGRSPADQERVLLQELGHHEPALLERPRLVVGTKADVAPDGVEFDGRRISAVTHEGLGPLIGAVSRLVEEARAAEGEVDPSARYREALADCVEESDRVLIMLNTLMDISEAESGAMPLRREPALDLARAMGGDLRAEAHAAAGAEAHGRRRDARRVGRRGRRVAGHGEEVGRDPVGAGRSFLSPRHGQVRKRRSGLGGAHAGFHAAAPGRGYARCGSTGTRCSHAARFSHCSRLL